MAYYYLFTLNSFLNNSTTKRKNKFNSDIEDIEKKITKKPINF